MSEWIKVKDEEPEKGIYYVSDGNEVCFHQVLLEEDISGKLSKSVRCLSDGECKINYKINYWLKIRPPFNENKEY